MVRRRGDNIPPISDYAHWNEDAYYMWYQENKYDMEHADEIIDDDIDDGPDPEPDYNEIFNTEEEARAKYEEICKKYADVTLGSYADGKLWYVEAWK